MEIDWCANNECFQCSPKYQFKKKKKSKWITSARQNWDWVPNDQLCRSTPNTFCASVRGQNRMNKHFTIFYVLLFSFSIPSIYLFPIYWQMKECDGKKKSSIYKLTPRCSIHNRHCGIRVNPLRLRTSLPPIWYELWKIIQTATLNKRKNERKIMNYDFDFDLIRISALCSIDASLPFPLGAYLLLSNSKMEEAWSEFDLLLSNWTWSMICFDCLRFVKLLAIHWLVANQKMTTK